MAIGYKGTKQDIVIRQGAQLWALPCVARHADGTPFDLAGYSLRAVLSKSWSQPSPTLVLTVAITDASAGKFTVSATSAQTATLKCGETESDPRSQYQWQLDATDPDGETIPFFYGLASVFRQLAAE